MAPWVTGAAPRPHYPAVMFIVASTAATAVRYPLGLRASSIGPRPAKQLELYEFEGCPYCRKVREALTMLDLEVLVRPTPRNGTRFRPEAIARGGKSQFPLLVDPNHAIDGGLIYESDAIVKHLYAQYGKGAPPLGLRLGALGTATSAIASGLRASHGRAARASKAPAQPLVLWSFESSPYCRYVREAMCELELPYVLHNLGGGSARRDAFRAQHGKVMVPYLEDPNTGAKMFESRDIVAYLNATYAG